VAGGSDRSRADPPGQAAEELTSFVMPAHGRSKNGVASLSYVAGIHDFIQCQRRGWPEQVRP
jgi:hypothetical protein